jgi:replication-associated recombination protein RarA
MSDKLQKALFWDKYRPTEIEDVILPDRIKKLVQKGIHTNMLFHGTSGIGKTTLARILIKDHPHLILGSKLGVEELRTKVDRFCKEMSIGEDPNKLKIVFFEEFDRASKQLQEELKSFMEIPKYMNRIRFIATTNNVQKIDPAIKSRFNYISFNLTPDEFTEVRKGYRDRIFQVIKEENIEIEKSILADIFKKRFPDFRAIWQDIQYYTLTGFNNSVENDTVDTSLFDYILGDSNVVQTWNYLYKNWSEKPEVAFELLGREFFEYLKEKGDKQNVLANVLITVSEYSDLRLPNAVDPFVTLNAQKNHEN